jgi:NADPH-dependent ferric siderophore reductase
MIDDIINQSQESMESFPGTRRVQRVRHEIHRRDVEVVQVQRLSAGFIRVTFADESLADFVSASFDDHVKLMVPDGAGEFARRDYTPRRFDRARRELSIEFALHGHGPASEWARHVTVGQRVVVAGPRGSMIIPLDYEWHLLAGDATAWPAISRRLEELPAAAHAIVIALANDAAERRAFESAARVQTRWVTTDDALVSALRALPWPSGDGFAWCAGEASTMAQVRGVLLQEKAQPKEAMRVAAYWKRGTAEFHETLDA